MFDLRGSEFFVPLDFAAVEIVGAEDVGLASLAAISIADRV